MAVTYTQSVASGYATDVLFYNVGPTLRMVGHYSSPSAATAIFETGMYAVTANYVQDADVTTFKLSANANGTIAVICSGLVTGATGYFEFTGF